MSFVFPKYVYWSLRLDNISDPYKIFGKNTSEKIRKSWDALTEAEYRFVLETADGVFLDKFIPIYESYISGKNGQVFDIRKRILEEKKTEKYFSFSLFQKQQFLGGMIFRLENSENIRVAYKVFPIKPAIKLATNNFALLADYLLFEYAIKNGYKKIYHGKDRNPYGVSDHSSAGVAAYKLLISARPEVADVEENTFSNLEIKNLEITDRDMMVFLGEKKGEKIKKALLISRLSQLELEKKYSVFFHCPDLETEVITLPEKQ